MASGFLPEEVNPPKNKVNLRESVYCAFENSVDKIILMDNLNKGDINIDLDGSGNADTAKKFCVDYSKRGTAKCRKCKKLIEKSLLRIGKYVIFKGKIIIQYYHISCAFAIFEKARSPDNIVKNLDELDGVEHILEDERIMIRKYIEDTNKKSTTNVHEAPKVIQKKKIEFHAAGNARKKKLKSHNEPLISCLLTQTS